MSTESDLKKDQTLRKCRATLRFSLIFLELLKFLRSDLGDAEWPRVKIMDLKRPVLKSLFLPSVSAAYVTLMTPRALDEIENFPSFWGICTTTKKTTNARATLTLGDMLARAQNMCNSHRRDTKFQNMHSDDHYRFLQNSTIGLYLITPDLRHAQSAEVSYSQFMHHKGIKSWL